MILSNNFAQIANNFSISIGWRAMQRPYLFHIMLEGKEENRHYFFTISILANEQKEAIDVALKQAHKLNYDIIGIEDIEEESVKQDKLPTPLDLPKIVKIFGRAYFNN
jgi:hypothetical protein